MKRKLFLILTIVLCLGGLTVGCGKSDQFPDEETFLEEDEDEEEEEEEEEEPEEEPAKEEEAPAEIEAPAEAEAPAEVAQPEPKKESADPEDFVLYDANGAQVTLENVKLDGTNNIKAMLSLVNNNPDNKKVNFELNSLVLNGINIYASASREAKAGDSNNAELNISNYVNDYANTLKQLDETVETVPVETIDCYYRVRIGSDGEWENGKVSFKTASYKGGIYEKAYGDIIYDTEVGDAMLVVYCKPVEEGYTVTVKSVGDVDIQNWSAYMNCKGKSFSCDWYNGSGTLRSGTAFFAHFKKTAQDIRADYEIPNDEPLDLQLKFENRNNGSYNEVFIPIELPE